MLDKIFEQMNIISWLIWKKGKSIQKFSIQINDLKTNIDSFFQKNKME